ncbi:hypothetical protein BH10PSE19_BH10PSE19_07310 [soil metagenome]
MLSVSSTASATSSSSSASSTPVLNPNVGLVRAVTATKPDDVKRFLDLKANPNVKKKGGVSVLELSLQKFNEHSGSMLGDDVRIEVDVDVKQSDSAQVIIAALLTARADPDTRTHLGTPMLQLVAHGSHRKNIFYRNVIQSLLEAKAKVDEKDECDGKTVLSCFAAAGNVEGLQELLAAGADVNKRNRDDSTPLLSAACSLEENIGDTIKLLVEAKADIAAVDKWRRSALWYSCEAGGIHAVKLLELKASAHVSTCDGSTPLHALAKLEYPPRDFTQIVTALVDAKLDLNALYEEESAFHILHKKGWKTRALSLLHFKADAHLPSQCVTEILSPRRTGTPHREQGEKESKEKKASSADFKSTAIGAHMLDSVPTDHPDYRHEAKALHTGSVSSGAVAVALLLDINGMYTRQPRRKSCDSRNNKYFEFKPFIPTLCPVPE